MFISFYDPKENLDNNRQLNNQSPATARNEKQGTFKTDIHKIIEAYLNAESQFELLVSPSKSNQQLFYFRKLKLHHKAAAHLKTCTWNSLKKTSQLLEPIQHRF